MTRQLKNIKNRLKHNNKRSDSMRPVRHLKRINSQQKTGERCDKEGRITTIHNKQPENPATKKVKSQQFTTKTGELCNEEGEITTIHNKTREHCNKKGEIATIHNKTGLSNENPKLSLM